MDRKVAMLIFLPMFIGISFLMNFFTLASFNYMFGRSFGFKIVIIAFFLSFSYLFFAILEKKMDGSIIRFLFILASVWFGVVFLAFIISIVLMLYDLVFGLQRPWAGMVACVFLLILCIYSFVNARRIHVKEISIPVKGLKRNLTIVQASDIHVGTILGKGFLKKVVNIINSLESDFVVLTGDLVDGSGPLMHDLYLSLNDIKQDVFFIIGNHEIYEGIDSVVKTLKDTKLKILRDKSINYDGIQIIGIDYQEKKEEVEKILGSGSIKYDRKKPSLLLYHTPVNLEILKKYGISLHLAGHTHGGQIFPFNLLVRLAYPFVYGLQSIDEHYSYISSGTGTWGPPMRLGTKSEIVRITLRKQ